MKKIELSKTKLASINIERDEFHGEWNYTILPITSNRVINTEPFYV